MQESIDMSMLGCGDDPRAREVTLIQMSFADCDIWIALPGRQVTFVEASTRRGRSTMRSGSEDNQCRNGFRGVGGMNKDSWVKKSSEQVDPVEGLIQIVNQSQESDAEDERRLYDPCSLNGLDFQRGSQPQLARLRKS